MAGGLLLEVPGELANRLINAGLELVPIRRRGGNCVAGVGALGLLLGAIALRLSGFYFAITTFVFTLR